MKRLLMISVLVATAYNASAQNYNASAQNNSENELRDSFNPIMTAVTSQSIAADARSGAMGDAGTATDPDVFSQAWNPAKYPFTISRAALSLNYTPWLRKIASGIALLNATGYYRIGDQQAVSASVRYFSLGDVSVGGDNNMTVRPYELGVDIAYSRLLTEHLSAGVALRYLYSDLSGHYNDQMEAGSAFAADIALYWNKYVTIGNRESRVAWGLNIRNIGSKINYGGDYSYFIPTQLRLGASWMLPINEYNRISFAVDATKLLVPSRPLREEGEDDESYTARIQRDYYDMGSIKGIFKSFGDSDDGFKGEMQEIEWSLGTEYTYNDKFSLRAGYHHQSQSQGGLSYVTVGAGFNMNVMAIDAGYVIGTTASNPLDQTFRVSLTFDFDGLREIIGKKRSHK